MISHRSNFLPRFLFRTHRRTRGQSFVELSLVVVVLALLLAGVVEFGFMLNNYLHVLDGAREGARYSSTNLVFFMNPDGSIQGYYRPEFYYLTAAKSAAVMEPVILNPIRPDDIVISVFSVAGNNLVRFPPSKPNGWSLCAHYKANPDDSAVVFPVTVPPSPCTGSRYGGFAAYFGCISAPVPSDLGPAWSAGCTVRSSQLSSADVLAHMDPAAPNSGVLLVEVYYNYPQLLKLPVFTSVIPDPVPLYVYSVMPLSSAEPTQGP